MFAVLLLALSTPPADLVLLGVVVSPRSERSVALLRGDGRTRLVAEGEAAFGGRVEAIAPHGVRVHFDGETVEVRLGGFAPVAASIAAPADPGAMVLPRGEVERRLALEVPRILSETTLVPVTDGSEVAGFALTRVPEGSLLTEAGLRAGDVLLSVNDVPIDSLATLAGLWGRLRGESALRAEVLRNGAPVTLRINLE